jgi:hypothetical protein
MRISNTNARFSFRNEKRITFLTWDLLLDFGSESRDLIQDLVYSVKVSSKKIEDLSIL